MNFSLLVSFFAVIYWFTTGMVFGGEGSDLQNWQTYLASSIFSLPPIVVLLAGATSNGKWQNNANKIVVGMYITSLILFITIAGHGTYGSEKKTLPAIYLFGLAFTAICISAAIFIKIKLKKETESNYV
ncbi:hypothetical protein [Chromobacterium sp. CV08]|uniref:hypothetical protein n=1 Tax=Chromobacterium sp. CV08 TaxID=3133274 RepID=UPI003DA8551F